MNKSPDLVIMFSEHSASDDEDDNINGKMIYSYRLQFDYHCLMNSLPTKKFLDWYKLKDLQMTK